MSPLRYMFRSLSVLNMALIVVSCLMFYYFVLPLIRTEVIYTTPPPKKSAAEAEEVEARSDKTRSPLDYSAIAEHNLFHPDRKIPVEKKEEAPLPKPDFVLYGILSVDDVVIVYMEDKKAPLTTPGRGKRQVSLKKGDMLSGFKLEQVGEDRVTMLRGEERIVVPIIDKGKDRAKAVPVAQQPQRQPIQQQRQPIQQQRQQQRQQPQNTQQQQNSQQQQPVRSPFVPAQPRTGSGKSATPPLSSPSRK